MKSPNRIELVKKLYNLTRQGKINWESTALDNQFAVHFPESSVLIIENESQFLFSYHIEVTNRRADTVEKVHQNDLGNILDLEELYIIARDNALEIESSIDHVLSQLESIENT